MSKRRPKLPSGLKISGSGIIRKSVYADELFELYEYETENSEFNFYSILNVENFETNEISILKDWWSINSAKMNYYFELTDGHFGFGKDIIVNFRIKGNLIDGHTFIDADDTTLFTLFNSIIENVQLARSAGYFPKLDTNLCFLSRDFSTFLALLSFKKCGSEEDELKDMCRFFFKLCTGIHVKGEMTDIPDLKNWSRNIGDKISKIIQRCLSTSNERDSIKTFDVLEVQLGRKSRESVFHENQIISTDMNNSNRPFGLDKVAGMKAQKQLRRKEIVEPGRNPQPYLKYGLTIPNGILLYGPPGCGKTYIARLLAEELAHYFIEIVPSEIASPYIHQSVLNIRNIFEMAAENAPSIIFIDEFEALVPSRTELSGHQQYKSEEVNEFLVHLNSCSEKKIFIIAATNRPDKIDSAIRRTGRLDKLIYVGPPDEEARQDMLRLHLRGRPTSSSIDIKRIADRLQFYSASDLKFLVDEAARISLHLSEDISDKSFELAMSKIVPSISLKEEIEYLSIDQRGI